MAVDGHFVNAADKIQRVSATKIELPAADADGSGTHLHTVCDGGADIINAIDIENHGIVRFITHADEVLPGVIWNNTATGVVRDVIRVTHRESESMTAGAGVEIELFTTTAVAEGDDARIVRLSASFDPGLDGKDGTVRESAEINALNVSDVTVIWRQAAKAYGRVGIVRVVARLIQAHVEILSVVAAPGIGLRSWSGPGR